jgi:hypothetical protein
MRSIHTGLSGTISNLGFKKTRLWLLLENGQSEPQQRYQIGFLELKGRSIVVEQEKLFNSRQEQQFKMF